jgi:hypothetical protein
MVQTNYDAMACYDRIVPNLAALASQKFEVAATMKLANTGTLEKEQYELRSKLGPSDEAYSHCTDYQIHSTGQGSSNSPSVSFPAYSLIVLKTKQQWQSMKRQMVIIAFESYVAVC